MSVQAKHGGELSDEDFRKFTLYCNQSNNYHDDTQRAKILGQTNEDVRIAPGAIAVSYTHLTLPTILLV